jgi:hypothetical protein
MCSRTAYTILNEGIILIEGTRFLFRSYKSCEIFLGRLFVTCWVIVRKPKLPFERNAPKSLVSHIVCGHQPQ